MRALAVEIQNRTPLRNIHFTNHYAASYIGRVILDGAADIESLEFMGEMGVDEATNRVGALISRVSSLCLFLFFFVRCLYLFLTLSLWQIFAYVLYRSNSQAPEVVEWAAKNEEWLEINEPRLAALEGETAAQSTRLEEAEAEKLRVAADVADLKARMARCEGQLVELEAANINLNTARDEAIAGRIIVQEELNFCKSDRYKRNIVDDF